jgi:30S ribosomal protein S31
MGKGDRRTRRGKLFRGTFGKSRKHKVGTTVPAASIKAEPEESETKPEAPKKKKAAKKKAE